MDTGTASHKVLTLEVLSSLSMLALQREAASAEERLLGHLRQSVPQNGRVHLQIIDQTIPEPLSVGELDVSNFAFSNTANTL